MVTETISRSGGEAKLSSASGRRSKAQDEGPRAGRPTLHELERRKARVREVATELFVHNGYAATTLVDVAKAAGVATRTLYQHFGDKEALFIQIMTSRETGAVYAPPTIPDEASLFEAMMLVARYICDVSLRPRSVDLMRLVVAESRRFPDFMMKLCEATFARFRANVAALFEDLTERGVAPALDPAASANLLVDLVLGTTPLLVYAGWTSSRPTDADLEAKVELFILGRFGPDIAADARVASPARGSRRTSAPPAARLQPGRQPSAASRKAARPAG